MESDYGNTMGILWEYYGKTQDGCTAVRLYGCLTARLYGWTAVRLYGWTAVLCRNPIKINTFIRNLNPRAGAEWTNIANKSLLIYRFLSPGHGPNGPEIYLNQYFYMVLKAQGKARPHTSDGGKTFLFIRTMGKLWETKKTTQNHDSKLIKFRSP